jgi:Ca-activated chloride channel family protein
MRDDDTINLITFAGSAQSFAAQAVANTADNRERAIDFLVRTGSGGGGTEMLTGVRAALDAPKDPARLRMVLFMTDGYIGNESQIFSAIAAGRGDARVFALGVGSSVNRFLVDGLARVGRGAATIMGPGEDPEAVVGEFYEGIDRPVLTDISIDWGDLRVAELAPGHLPDLYAGQPVVVHGRYEGKLHGQVRLRGKLGGADVELPVNLAGARTGEHDGLASMWARRRIDDLSGYPFHQSPGELTGPQRDAVVALALRHRILTAYTSFVAVEERQEARPDGTLRTVQVPVESPRGVSMDASDRLGLGSLGLIGTGGGGHGSGYGRGSGAGFGGRATRVPTVRQAKPDVLGSLDRDLIRRIVRAHANEVRHCYEQGLARDPNLKGRVTLAFTVDRVGAVTADSVAEDTLADPAVGVCIAKVARRWKFPGGVGVVQIRYPFVLEPG